MQPHLTHCVFVCDMINLLLTESMAKRICSSKITFLFSSNTITLNIWLKTLYARLSSPFLFIHFKFLFSILFIVDVCLFKIIHCFNITIMRQHTIFIELFETVNLYTSRLLISDTFLRLSTSTSSSLILKTLSSTLWRWGKTNTSITVFQHFLHLPCPCTYELIKWSILLLLRSQTRKLSLHSCWKDSKKVWNFLFAKSALLDVVHLFSKRLPTMLLKQRLHSSLLWVIRCRSWHKAHRTRMCYWGRFSCSFSAMETNIATHSFLTLNGPIPDKVKKLS